MQNDAKLEGLGFDVWTVLNFLVSAVSMVAQLAGLETKEVTKGLARDTTREAYKNLREEIDRAIVNVENLVRLLHKAPGSIDVMGAQFTFGQSRLRLSPADTQRYARLAQQLCSNAGTLSVWTHYLIQNDPGLAKEIGDRFAAQFDNAQQRINDCFAGFHTNEDVLNECLLMLDSFNRVLGSLEPRRN